MRPHSGGIAALAPVFGRFRDAFDYDLMERFGVRLRDVGRTFGWSAVPVILRHLPPDSATVRKAKPDQGGWTRQDAMTADLIDAVRWLQWTVVSAFSKSKPREPVPYPRPWDTSTRRVGSGAVPVSDFWDWWDGDGAA